MNMHDFALISLLLDLIHPHKLSTGLVSAVTSVREVDPLELVIWLPALCRKKEVPYCFIKGKSRLGQLVGKKTASCVAVTAVKREDQNELEKLCENFMASFNENTEHRRRWGGGVMGLKSQHVRGFAFQFVCAFASRY